MGCMGWSPVSAVGKVERDDASCFIAQGQGRKQCRPSESRCRVPLRMQGCSATFLRKRAKFFEER